MKIADLKPILLPTKIQQIDSHLYRGNAIFSFTKALRVKQKGVTQVIDLRHENGFFVRCFKKLEQLYCRLLKMDYVNKSFYTNNAEQLPKMDFYEGLIDQINKSPKTYLHCHFGKHRTGLSIAMYQRNKGVAKDEILKQLMESDWKTEPQKRNLKTFLAEFLGQSNDK